MGDGDPGVEVGADGPQPLDLLQVAGQRLLRQHLGGGRVEHLGDDRGVGVGRGRDHHQVRLGAGGQRVGDGGVDREARISRVRPARGVDAADHGDAGASPQHAEVGAGDRAQADEEDPTVAHLRHPARSAP
ncbi:hypothetical protein [Nocardioides sp. TF02-7]|uniref:hypothetical protein n=1 Tax=Nocardioides sp. TF02-7 TaxID=2917724 RepID=UPI001F05DE89|nr:hypothetical protein [Nocardioides sp. TF02-7]UMG93545.1 hypothetical protein MF408_04935 [Nocardioides sp. TF02-7]